MTTTGTAFVPVKIKKEREDEAEIVEMAAKMKEANKAKVLAAAGGNSPRPSNQLLTPMAPGGQMGILNYLTRKNGNEAKPPEEKKPAAPDESSWKGHFGWDMLGKCHIPYIFRSGEKYVAVRMVEMKLLNKYLNYLHPDIYSCTYIRSYYITDVEARLLNDINGRHCDSQFGRDTFSQKDLVVRMSDANEFYTFLDVCYNKLLHGSTNSKEKCGFIRINKESVVPYTVRDDQKYVPLFYFEGETDNLKLKADQLKGWDLSYLKFCCKVQGIRNELFASETCSVISLSDIKSYFPPGTEFEEYWPHKVVDSQLLIATKGMGLQPSGGGHWTRAPAAPPPVPAGPPTPPRARRPAPPRHPHSAAGLSASVQAAVANGWTFPGTLTQAQTQQVLRLAQAQAQAQAQALSAQAAAAQAAARYLPQQRPGPRAMQQQFSNASLASMSMQQQQQQQPPPLVRNNSNAMSAMNGHTESRKGLIPIPEVTLTGNATPYKVRKALVEKMMVPCINWKPYLYQELLMTLPDLASHFFPRVTLTTCRSMLDALNIGLYRPNSLQLQVLRSSGKCKSAAAGENGMALVQIRDVMGHMPQFKYMLRSGMSEDPAPAPRPAHAHAHAAPHAKRARAN